MDNFQKNRDIFFKTLKKVREQSNKTQQEIADILGISIKQYQKYEKKTLPPHEKLFTLNETFETDLSRHIYRLNVPHVTYALEDEAEYSHVDNEKAFLKQRVKDLEKQVETLNKIIGLLERDDGTAKNA